MMKRLQGVILNIVSSSEGGISTNLRHRGLQHRGQRRRDLCVSVHMCVKGEGGDVRGVGYILEVGQINSGRVSG